MDSLITLVSTIIKIVADRSSRGLTSFFNKLVASVAILTLASIFVFIGLLFIVWAIYLAFNSILSPPLAAFVSGGITILFSLLLYLIIRLLINRKGEKTAGKDKFQDIGVKDFSNDITLLNENPFLTVVLTLLAGYLIGSSPSARHALAEVIVKIVDQYFKISKTKD